MSFELLALDYVKTGAQTIGKAALQGLLSKRAEAAREVLVDKLAKGKAKLKDLPEDDVAAVVYRYMRAAEEGAARLNLKLLADVIVGQDAEPGFYANDFLLWADVLSGLRREEVAVLGTLHSEAHKLDYRLPYTGELWTRCQTSLEDQRGITPAVSDALAAALMRTGLVTILGGLMSQGHAYMPSPNLQKLAQMADFESYYMEEPYIV